MSPFDVGDFDAAWENYDHNGGPQLITEAQEPIKSGDARPNFRLVIGGVNMTQRLISAEVSFSSEGDSGMEITVAHQLNAGGFQRAGCRLWIGYGTKLVPFFAGRLAEPKDDPNGLFSTASAYGIGTQMGERYFRGRWSAEGMTVEEAFWALVEKMGTDPDRFFFDGEGAQVLSKDISEFGLEVSLREAEQTILEPLGYVAYDQTAGMHVIRKPQRYDQVLRANLHGVWDDSMYPQGGFEFSSPTKNFYANVKVFRRNEDFAGGGEATQGGEGMVQDENGEWVPSDFAGSEAETQSNVDYQEGRSRASEYAVYAKEDVAENTNYNVNQGRSYIIPDFAGSQADAEALAAEYAAAFSAGVGQFSFSVAPCDYALYEFFGVERIERVQSAASEGAFQDHHFTSVAQEDLVLYACQIEEMNLTIAQGTWDMELSGTAVERERSTVVAAGTLTEIDLSIGGGGAPPDPEPAPGTPSAVAASADTVKVGTDTVVAGGSS